MLRPRWAVVVEPYVRLLALPEAGNSITGHLRGGEVVEIVEIGTTQFKARGTNDPWFLVEDANYRGWAVSTAFAVYGSRAQAENAAQAFPGQSGGPAGR